MLPVTVRGQFMGDFQGQKDKGTNPARFVKVRNGLRNFAQSQLREQTEIDEKLFIFKMVRVEGLEPPRLAAPEPKSGASANFATPASVAVTIKSARGMRV